MNVYLYSLLVGAAVTAVITAATCWVMKDNSWDKVVALIASMAVLLVIAFSRIPWAYDDETANGFAFAAGVVQTFYFWVVAVVTLLFVHPLVRRYRP
jgi:hypothetical protein